MPKWMKIFIIIQIVDITLIDRYAYWNYLGYVDQGKTINYITKYMLKENEKFKEFKPKVLASQKKTTTQDKEL